VTTPPASRTWSKQIAAIKKNSPKKLEKSDQHLPGGREGVAKPKNSGSNNSNLYKKKKNTPHSGAGVAAAQNGAGKKR
jgi:hypothetical protein